MNKAVESPSSAEPRVRLDRWLNAARVFGSRQLAAAACTGGKVDVEGKAAKPHRLVGADCRLRVTAPRGERILVIVAVADHRQSPVKARELYLDESPPAPPPVTGLKVLPRRDRGGGRPSRRDRRQLDRFRGDGRDPE